MRAAGALSRCTASGLNKLPYVWYNNGTGCMKASDISMKIKRLAQSTFLFTTHAGRTLLLDPGKYNLDPGRFTLESFPTADIVVITHKHEDHFDLSLVKELISRSSPMVITNTEIAETLRTHGIESRSTRPGDVLELDGYRLDVIRTDHVVRDEEIVNFGVVVSADGVSLYHTSDTRFIDPERLPTETRAPYLVLPISNRGVVMGIDDALVFAAGLKPKLAIPVHYDSPKDQGRVDPNEFAQKATRIGVPTRVMAFGEELSL